MMFKVFKKKNYQFATKYNIQYLIKKLKKKMNTYYYNNYYHLLIKQYFLE